MSGGSKRSSAPAPERKAAGRGGKTVRRKRIGRSLAALLLVLAAGFLLYAAVYYRADQTALDALRPDGTVQISRTDYGWFFDGPSEERALIFYPGGKVEETAYAPLLRLLAEQGMDVCLVKMPLHLAVLAPDRAELALAEHDYESWYIGGHSLGGVIAASYASGHPEAFRGVVLLAAYPIRPLDPRLQVLSIYGSEDGVLDRTKLAEGMQYLPEEARVQELPGGNHAQFGSYGPQRGDGEALIRPEEQWAETAALLREALG